MEWNSKQLSGSNDGAVNPGLLINSKLVNETDPVNIASEFYWSKPSGAKWQSEYFFGGFNLQ